MINDWQDLSSTAPKAPPNDWQDISPAGSPAATVQKSVDDLKSAQQKPGMLSQFGQGVARGFKESGVGMGQTLNDIGIGSHIGLPPNSAYNEYEKKLEDDGKGSGIAGGVGEFLGDTRNLATLAVAPEIKGASLLAKGVSAIKAGAKLGAGYSATAPSTEDEGLAGRALNTAKGSAEGAFLMPTVGAAGYGLAKTGQAIGNIFKKGAQEYNPLQAMNDIGQNYWNKQQESNALFDKMRFLATNPDGSPRTVIANDYQNFLNNSINSLANSVSPSEQKAARLLKNIRDRRVGYAPNSYSATVETGENLPATASQLENTAQPTTKIQPLSEIPYTDAVDVKQALNELYDPSHFANKGDRAIGSLASRTNDILLKAGEQTPEFGDALADANSHHVNEIADVFRNDTLKKFWNPDDYSAFKQGKMTNVDTMSRARSMLDKIKTPEDLQAVAQALPEDSRASLLKAKYDQLAKDSNTSKERLIQFGHAIVDVLGARPLSAAKSLYRGVTGAPEKTDLEQNLEKWVPKQDNSMPTTVGATTGALAARGAAEQQQEPPHIMVHPRDNYYEQNQADGGETYSAAEWLSLVRKHGKKHGLSVNDRRNPESINKMRGIVADYQPPRTKYAK